MSIYCFHGVLIGSHHEICDDCIEGNGMQEEAPQTDEIAEPKVRAKAKGGLHPRDGGAKRSWCDCCSSGMRRAPFRHPRCGLPGGHFVQKSRNIRTGKSYRRPS